MNEATAAAPSRWTDFKTLTKPRITRMVALTAMAGWYLGHKQQPDGSAFLWFAFGLNILGTALCCIGAGIYNQAIEHRTDAMMHRTRERPLAAGRFQQRHAWGIATTFSLTGTGVLVAAGQPLAAFLAALTIVLYAGVYTPMKRHTTLALLVGAIPGATPPMIGFAGAFEAAAEGTNPAHDLAAWEQIAFHAGFWLPFLVMFVWQIPHFLAIAWLYREDYARARLVMLPVVDPSGRRTFVQILLGCLLLLPVGAWSSASGLSGKWHFVISALLGIGFLIPAVILVRRPTKRNARILFFASLIYLPLVLASMLFA